MAVPPQVYRPPPGSPPPPPRQAKHLGTATDPPGGVSRFGRTYAQDRRRASSLVQGALPGHGHSQILQVQPHQRALGPTRGAIGSRRASPPCPGRIILRGSAATGE